MLEVNAWLLFYITAFYVTLIFSDKVCVIPLTTQRYIMYDKNIPTVWSYHSTYFYVFLLQLKFKLKSIHTVVVILRPFRLGK